MTSRWVHPTGLWIYCGSGAVAAPTETVATLRACGASLAIAMVEGITPGGSQRMPTVSVARFCDAARAANIATILCAFPDVLGGEDALLRSRDHLVDLGDLIHCRTQLDAEPRRRRTPAGLEVVHWTPALLGPWLHIADLSITTTRIEAPHLGPHDRLCLAQLEQPTSFDTVGDLLDDRHSDAMDVFCRYSQVEDIVLVGGAFDLGRTDVRTAEDMRHDFERARPQSQRSGAYALWDARALGRHRELCDAARSMALAA